mmetsp:Transcript_167110/g.295877  ORF Transcript_167110/g.295877 Transcript_167110/m.295877 type:complete len:206 (+) Transcript_167110:342-959(+)
MHGQSNLLLRLLRLSGFQHDIPGANVALHTEPDTFFACLDLHCLAKLLQVPADLHELSRRQTCKNLVLLLGNLHVLAFDLHEFQVKVSNPIILTTFTLEAHSVSIILPFQLQRIVWAAHLEDLAKRLHIHAKRGSAIALELGEGRFPQQQGNQGHMRAVHGLDLQALLTTIEVHLFAKILHGIYNLFQEDSLLQLSLKDHCDFKY